MLIELLAFEGCPNAEVAHERIVLALAGRPATIVQIEVDTPDLAIAHRFLGSPSVRVNGQDVEADAYRRRDFGLMCRTYPTSAERSEGAPSVAMIRAAIAR